MRPEESKSQPILRKTFSRKSTTMLDENNPIEDEICELPTAERHVISKVTSNDYLKLFRAQNDTHDPDREKPRSLVKNLHMPKNKADLYGNPFFDKKK